FRGINVGANHQVSMEVLKAVHDSLGLQDVLTYIRSGNVVFHSDEADVDGLRRHIEAGFEARSGFHSEVILRTSAELDAVIERNPFQGQPGKEPERVLVMFLAAHPDDAAQEALLQTSSGPEEIFFSGLEVYLYYPEGVGRSKLSGSFIEKKLSI